MEYSTASGFAPDSRIASLHARDGASDETSDGAFCIFRGGRAGRSASETRLAELPVDKVGLGLRHAWLAAAALNTLVFRMCALEMLCSGRIVSILLFNNVGIWHSGVDACR